MKNAIRWTAIFLLPLMLLAFLAPMGPHAAAAMTIALHHPATLLPVLGAGMLFPMGAPVNVDTLEKLRSSPPNGYEVTEDFLYDQQTYPAAGGAGLQLQFFQTNTGDRTLTNLAQAGQLPAPHYFRVQRIFLSPQSEPSVSAAADTAGRLRDYDRILNSARGVLTFANSATNRQRGPIPIRAIGQLGGSRGMITATGSALSPIQHIQNDGGSGFPFDIVLKWGETFSFTITFGPVAQAISANLDLQLALYGWRYVKSS